MREAAALPRAHAARAVRTAAVVVLATVWPWAPAAAQEPRAPEPVGTIPARTIPAGQSASFDLTPYFTDANGDALAYAATVSDVAVATVSVSANILTIAGVAPGTAVVAVFASDPGGLSATQRTEVTIEAPNRAPESVGTIPGQSLAPGQWISISVSSYFSDPEGDVVSFSATTSNEAVVAVEVSGDIVTITQTGTGTAMVVVAARDPAGLFATQTIRVASGSVQPARDPARPGVEQPEPPRLPREPAAPPAAQEAGPPMPDAARARELDPLPPRLLTGFIEPTGYTLRRDRSQAGAGYMGASPLAQAGAIGDVVPGIAQVSYGVTDDLTVTAGTGFVYYNVGAGGSDLFPYFAPKYRAYVDERVSVAVAGYAGMFLASETLTYYGGSVAVSMEAANGVRVHAAGGMLGVSGTVLGVTRTDQVGVAALGGDYLVTPQLGLAGEYRRVGFEDGTNIASAALRYIQGAIVGEAGLAYYLEDGAEIRPIASLAYRF